MNDLIRWRVLVATALVVVGCGNLPAQAQTWARRAPFPEASEELYGIASGGRLCTRIRRTRAPGWKPKALVFEYDPGRDTWTRKKNMRCLPTTWPSRGDRRQDLRRRRIQTARLRPAAWRPIDNVWEYDPAADSWKALAPLPTKRGSANAVVVSGKIYVIGGAGSSIQARRRPSSIPPGPIARSIPTEVYDPVTNRWEARSASARRETTRRPLPWEAGSTSSAGGSAAPSISRASNTDVVEMYDPATDQWGRSSPPCRRRAAPARGVSSGIGSTSRGESSGRPRFRRPSGRWRPTIPPRTAGRSCLPWTSAPRHGRRHHRREIPSGQRRCGVRRAPGAHIDTDVHEVLDIEAK